MDFGDYAQHMTKKYQLAVAIAVIKNKPENLTSEQYVAQLKEKIEKENSETNNANMILTGDFDLDDNDFDVDESNDSLIVNEFNERHNVELHVQTVNNLISIDEIIETLNHNECHKAASVDLVQDFNASTQEVNRNNEKADIEVRVLSDASTVETNSLDEVLRALKDIDDNKGHSPTNDINSTQNCSQIIPSTSFTNLNSFSEENMAVCDNFSSNHFDVINLVPKTATQVTIDERIKANVAKNFNKVTNLPVPDVRNKAPSENIQNDLEDDIVFNNTYDMEVDMALNEIIEPKESSNDLNTSFIIEKTAIVSKKIAEETNKQISSLVNQKNDDVFNKPNMTINVNKNPNTATTNPNENGTQDTIIYTLQGFTQNNSHISQSQYENIEIPQAFIYGNKNMSNTECIIQKNKISKTVSDKDTRQDNLPKNDNTGSQKPIELRVDSSEIQYIIDQSGKTYAVLQSIQLSHKATNKENADANSRKETQASLEINNKKDSQGIDKENLKGNNQATLEENIDKPNADIFESIDTEEYLDNGIDNSEEVVPFKVVKELSKIKAFLNRRVQMGSNDGSSSDSGYRSDSQNSFNSVSARLSDEWVDQSANCLYNYITHCPLVTVTQEIVTEISQVLGKLIDRLHEEEKYPLFLEELLDKIDSLLRELSEDGGSFENNLLEKDETIQRLLLLNKSTHILKFSIEKIANVLEKAHTNLTSKEILYELTNVTEVENLRYVFYTLEMFIQIYVKVKDSSQSTQNSQESRVLKKSSISEIWRKKWKPELKQQKNVGSQDKVCVLNKCGEVLNKIIVDCMDGYGLVSFAALQCFNLLQS